MKFAVSVPAGADESAKRAADGHLSVRDAALTYRPDIDGLRAVAVGLVLAYHAFPQLRTGGFIGVDVFFVISGYLITQLVLTGIRAGTFTLGVFYQRRVRRIVPALLVVLAACSVLGWLTLLPSELQSLGKSTAWAASFLANAFFARMGSGYFDRSTESNPLLHLWSLGVEEQFYLLWPLLLALAEKHGVTMRALGAVIVTSLAISIWGAWSAPAQHFYFPAPRAWELAVGGILAAWQLGSLPRTAADVASSRTLPQFCALLSSVAGLAMIAAGVMLLNAERTIPGIWGVIPICGAALLIAAGPLAPVNRWFLGSQPMIFVGRISYPLYLWHWPLLSFAQDILGHVVPPAVAAGAILIAFAAAYTTYRLVEVPIRHGALGRKAIPGLLAGLATFALGGTATGLGWIPARLSGPAATAWDKATNDWDYSGKSSTDQRTGFGTLTASSHRDRTVLFVGDSHIQQYWPRATRVIASNPDSARSAVFATYLGCPPLPGINGFRHGRNCSGFFDYAIELARRPDVDSVVFGAFWEGYLVGEYSSDEFPQHIYSVGDRTKARLQLDSPGTRLAFEQFQRAVAKLVSSGRRVFIVLSNPTSPRFDPISMFPSRVRLTARIPASFAAIGTARRVDVGQFESFVAPLMGRLHNIAALTGAQTVDPRLALCDGMVCPATGADGMPLYLDSNHLRASYAREQALFIDEILLAPDTGSHPSSPQ